jgi:hypothetical protein
MSALSTSPRITSEPVSSAVLLRRERQKRYRERLQARSEEEIKKDQKRLCPTGLKKCSDCRKRQSLSNFTPNSLRPDGLTGWCHACSSKDTKRRRQKLLKRTVDRINKDTVRLRGDTKIATKKCSDCEKMKCLADFPQNRYTPDNLANICKRCRSIRNKNRRNECKKLCDDVRLRGCVVCGLKELSCIDLAHVNREEKLRDSHGVRVSPARIISIRKLKRELKLVEPRCANCHATQTHEENQKRHMESNARPFQSSYLRRYAQVNLEKQKRERCIDCRIEVGDRFWMFDFDHVRGDKITEVGTMITKPHAFSDDALATEMTKCDLRCKNCHRKVTEQRRKNRILAKLSAIVFLAPPLNPSSPTQAIPSQPAASTLPQLLVQPTIH